MKEAKIFFSLLLVLTIHASLSWQSKGANSTTYSAFLECLESNTEPRFQISKSLYAQSNTSFTSVLRAYIRNARYNTSSTTKPLFIVTATDDSHVQATVLCSKTLGLQLKIRSGGHDYAGISYVSAASTPFVILDLNELRSVTVDAASQTAWVGAGATLGEVYYKLWQADRTLTYPAGICPTVAAGGHISGGGYGILIRKYGLTVDHLLDARLVDSNGNIYNDAVSMGNDLFWALKGGGGASFGVVLAYKIRLVPVPETVTVFRIERILDQNQSVTEVVEQWQQVAPATDDRLFMRMLLQPITSRVVRGTRTIRSTVIALFLGNADELSALVTKEFPVLGLKKENCMEMSWIDSVLWWANFDNGTAPEVLLDRNLNDANFLIRKSDYVQTPIPRAGLELLWKKMAELGKTGFVFNPYGGRMNEISPAATPFPHRKGNLFKIQYSVNWDELSDELDRNYTAQIRSLFSFMTPYVSKNPRRAFLNYRDLDIGVNTFGKNSYEEGKVYGVKYFGANFDRLVKAKTQIDPENFFRNEQSIPTLKRSISGVTRATRSNALTTVLGLILIFLFVKGPHLQFFS